MTTGLVSAMLEELSGIIELMTDRRVHSIGMRDYHEGMIHGQPVVAVFSRWGKVAAATTATTLIQQFGIGRLLFTGVAAAIDERLNIGDVVIADRLVQHDMDARPLMQRFEIPLLQKTWFESDPGLLQVAKGSVDRFLDVKNYDSQFCPEVKETFSIDRPACWTGAIASGDQFFASEQQREKLKEILPAVLCVEMEGAAVAQVCFEQGISCVVIRTISDVAGDKSHIDFPAFVTNVAGKYSYHIVKNIFLEFNSYFNS